jgi:hypothetical protein
MYGSKSVGAQPEIMRVNWYNPDEAVEFLKFDVYLTNRVGWVGAGAPQNGTEKKTSDFAIKNTTPIVLTIVMKTTMTRTILRMTTT